MSAFKRTPYTDMTEALAAVNPNAVTGSRLRCACGVTLLYRADGKALMMDYQRLSGATIVGSMGSPGKTGYAGGLSPVPAKARLVKCGDCARIFPIPALS